jgi:hypothetical protein
MKPLSEGTVAVKAPNRGSWYKVCSLRDQLLRALAGPDPKAQWDRELRADGRLSLTAAYHDS